MSLLTQAKTLSDWLLSEAELGYCREDVTVPTGLTLVSGEVLGQVTKGVAAAVMTSGPDTVTAAPAVGAAAKVGVYKGVCTVAGATGTFRMEDPDGIFIGTATVGTEFTTHLTFTITDAGASAAVGNILTITVAAGSLKYEPVDATATTGEAVAAGIVLEPVTTTADTTIAILKRGPALIKPNGLTWPTGWTTEIVTALAELKVLGIVARTDY